MSNLNTIKAFLSLPKEARQLWWTSTELGQEPLVDEILKYLTRIDVSAAVLFAYFDYPMTAKILAAIAFLSYECREVIKSIIVGLIATIKKTKGKTPEQIKDMTFEIQRVINQVKKSRK